ncbi:MAG: ABC transporter substrate-binding protein [Spirochaetota bacterium]|nr:ABC transporter substrate-binding protein [Spirochaetota bacterium]
MIRKSWLVFLSMFLVLAFFGCGKEPIKIGFVGPLTGDYANYGKLMTQAVKIAIEEKNNAGGIDGNMIKLIAEDSEGKVDKGNSAIEKLASIDKIYGLVGAVFSGTSLAIAPKCEREKIVMISPSATHKALTGKGKYIFRNVLSDELQAIVFAQYVYNVMKVKNVAILYLKNDYSQGLAGDFSKEFKRLGGRITITESGLQGDKDFKTQLTKIKSTNSEALFLPNYVADIAQTLEQAKQLGLRLKILSSDGFSNPEIFELAGDLANGVTFSGPPKESEGTENDLRKQFEVKYQDEWGEKPDSFSLNAYDGANILINAIEKCYNETSDEDKKILNFDREKIQKYVASTSNYAGVSGKITFLENGDASKNVGISIAEKKQYKQLGVYKLEKGRLKKVK